MSTCYDHWCDAQKPHNSRFVYLPNERLLTNSAAKGTGNSSTSWQAAYEKATAFVAQLELEEKVNLTRGYTEGNCIGNVGAVPRLGFKSICIMDAPAGMRGQEFVSAFPAGQHLASTWDKNYMYEYGKAYGSEYRGKGFNVALGPVSGSLGRMVRGGRNWEGGSPDPYLSGVQMGQITTGIQDVGVIATLTVSHCQQAE